MTTEFLKRGEAICAVGNDRRSTVGAETTLKRTGEAKILKSSGKFRNLLTAAMLLGVFAFIGKTTGQTIIDQGYCGGEGDGTNLTWVLTELNGDTTLTISGNGDMEDCTYYVRPQWYHYITGIETVIIGNNVTSIGNRAFSDCHNLISITIPNSVMSIGNYAFYDCSSLSSIIIPDSVIYIGNGTFWGCSNLDSITIPNGITNIEGSTFLGCERLSSITIPNSVIYIGGAAFQDCHRLTSITIPNGVTSIETNTFRNCSNLISITIPNSVTNIENMAFGNCTQLPSITIPNGVTEIKNLTFAYCSRLNSIIIPDSVKNIGSAAFSYCSGLTSVTIGSSVDSIEGMAFYYCNQLCSITSKTVTPPGLGSLAFYSVSANIPIYIPCGTKSAYQSAWSYFSNFIEQRDTTFYSASICAGSIYNDANFSNLTKDSIYYHTLQNVNGCDSVIELTLSYYPSVPLTTYAVEICEGDFYTDDNFTNLTKDSIYYNTLQNINGCDSVVELTLTVNLPDTTLLFDSIRQGETYNKNGFSVSEAGIYTQELQNVYDCDSVVVLHLAITNVGVVETHNYASLRIYPNLTNGQLIIENGELIIENVEIYDVVGQCVFTTPNPSKGGESSTSAQFPSKGGAGVVIDVSHLASGMYFLKVDNKVVRFVKE